MSSFLCGISAFLYIAIVDCLIRRKRSFVLLSVQEQLAVHHKVTVFYTAVKNADFSLTAFYRADKRDVQYKIKLKGMLYVADAYLGIVYGLAGTPSAVKPYAPSLNDILRL